MGAGVADASTRQHTAAPPRRPPSQVIRVGPMASGLPPSGECAKCDERNEHSEGDEIDEIDAIDESR